VNKLKIVIKIGGDLIKGGLPEGLINEITTLCLENRVILVHGGGDIVTDISTQLGHPPSFVTSPKGFRSRYTDRETAEIYTMVMSGKINKEIISTLQRRGIQAVGLSGLDGSLVQAKRKKQIVAINERGRRMLMKGDYTGTVQKVNIDFLKLLLDNGYVPVLSAIAMGEEAEPLNVDGDRLAASVASAVKAEHLLLLTDVEGVLINDKSVPVLSVYEAKEVLDKIGPGMITKLYAALEAVDGGVEEVHIASGLRNNPVTMALNHKNGTVIRK
jgi:acetylglutamate/LysW-gamma-L-alpha-aminoadipate kinase